jgi:predicted MPP superfamily phosphohydrolase
MNKLGFLIFFSIYFLINSYIFIRGRQALPKESLVQVVYTTLFLVFSLSFFVAVFFEGKISPVITAVAENIGGFWVVVFLYFFLMIFLADIFRLADYAFGIFPDKLKANYAQVKLYYFVGVMLLLAVFSMAGYINFSNPQTVNLNLELPAKNNHAEKLTIIAVSDVHLGDMIRKSRLKKYVSLINQYNPDVILIAGDLFDRNLYTIERQGMESELRKLKARYGVYAVLGNHEYFGNVNKAGEIIARSGITLLKDSVVTIDNKFVLIGRDDYTNRRRKPLQQLIANVDKDLPKILLDHQPVHLNEAQENNIDLQISGHTHNGQIFPINRIVSKIYELGYGYKQKGNTHFYVSSGLGLWGAPLRLGTQSEIVKVQLNVN